MTAYAQRSFAGGELAPSLYARTDQSKYASGLRTCRNLIVQRHGGITNRPGTQFITEIKDSLESVRLIPFNLSTEQSFVLEFGTGYIRVLTNGAYLTVGAPAAWADATAYVIGDLVSYLGVNYYAMLDHTSVLANDRPSTGANWATHWYPLTGAIFEIPAPYASGDLASLGHAQSNATLTIVHPSYTPRELVRTGTVAWTLKEIVFAPSIAAPATVAAPTGVVGGRNCGYAITAVSQDGDESLPTYSSVLGAECSEANPVDLTWDAVAGAKGYNIYRAFFPTWPYPPGYIPSYEAIGTSLGTAFRDRGVIENPLSTPPIDRNPFNAAGSYPSAVTYYQQRRLFGHSNTEPETIWASRIARYSNFTISFPLQDDDSVTFRMVGRQLNAVKHLLDLGRLIVFTQNEEKIVEGDDAGILRPDAINPRKISANGSGTLRPIEVDDSAIYCQARGTIVRDLKPISAESYQGSDLTVWSAHLFNGFELADWDYSESPNSIVWVARSDGKLLALTYLREHEIYGWHRHDTDGIVENVCVVPEGDEDKLYLVVRREIDGVTQRYIERMASRFYLNEDDAFFIDCGKTYNGRNTSAKTLTLTGGVTWNALEVLPLTASSAQFAPGDIGKVYILREEDADGNELSRIRVTIETYTSNTVVGARPQATVPVNLRAAAVTTWTVASDTITGLDHLEGETVSVLADGLVISSPNNSSLANPPLVVTGGTITLPLPYGVVHVGLPYISDMEPLDLDLPGGSTLKDKKVLVTEVGLYLERSRGVWIGDPTGPTNADPLNGLREWADGSTTEQTDFFKLKLRNEWGPGRFLVRQVDPLPITILSVSPIGAVAA